MTKKDYIKFADMMVSLHRMTTSEVFGNGSIPMFQVNNELVKVFESDNANFDIEKWNAYLKKRTEGVQP